MRGPADTGDHQAGGGNSGGHHSNGNHNGSDDGNGDSNNSNDRGGGSGGGGDDNDDDYVNMLLHPTATGSKCTSVPWEEVPQPGVSMEWLQWDR